MHESHNPVYDVVVEIQALEWVQGRIHDLVITKVEKKDYFSHALS